MEADAYERVTAALSDRTRTVELPVPYPPGIDKIVWSVWDYILGPELKFSWEVVPEALPPNPRTDSELSDAQSSDSVSARLEYDDEEVEYLRTAAEVYACGKCGAAICGGNCQDTARWVSTSPLTGGMGDSQSTIGGGTETSGTTSTEDLLSATDTAQTQGPLTALKMALYTPETSVTESSKDPLNLSFSEDATDRTEMEEVTDENENEKKQIEDERKVSTITSHSDFTDMTEPGSDYTAIRDSRDSAESFDSTSLGAVQEETDEFLMELMSRNSLEDGAIPSTSRDNPESVVEGTQQEEGRPSTDSSADRHMTDEQYAAIHTLSSEIYRSHFAENMVDAKLLCVAERGLVVSANVFSAQNKGVKAIHSVSLLMREERLGWFLRRQEWFRRYFLDLVPRIKASIHVRAFQESREEVLSRMTTEWTQFLLLLGSLEQWPLVAIPLKIQDSYLSKMKLGEDSFLSRAISASLQSCGHTVVLGTKKKDVHRMMTTLCFFLPDEEKWCCLMPAVSVYSPYVKIQGFSREEWGSVESGGVYSFWQVSVVDMDKRAVFLSPAYPKQRILKKLAQKRDLARILNSPDEIKKKLKIVLRLVSRTECVLVKDFMERMELLPFDHVIREGFLRQFLRHIAQRAFAFINYLQHISDNGAERKKVELSKVRKALDLREDGTFGVVLGMAERMKPTIAEFLALAGDKR